MNTGDISCKLLFDGIVMMGRYGMVSDLSSTQYLYTKMYGYIWVKSM